MTEEEKKAIETVLNLIEKKDIDIIEAKEANRQLSIELQKKDKIIDEMAEQLTTPIHSKEWVKNYFKNKVETEDK